MNLYEITAAMANIQQMFDDGVPEDQLKDSMDLMDGDFKQKAESILYVIANAKSEAEAVKLEIERLSNRVKVRTNLIERLKNYLLENMDIANISKVDNGLMTASIRKGAPALQINNEDAIPDEFKKISTTVSTDKRGLLKALKTGKAIPGAEVVQGKNTLTIK